MSESSKQAHILKALKVFGCYAAKIQVANKAGTHDILACYKGRFYSIEVKDLMGKASPLQLQKRREVVRAGGKAIIAKTVKEVIELLKKDSQKYQS